MALDVQITIDVRGTVRDLKAIANRHFPFAMKTALNGTAYSVLDDIKHEMGSIFDRPTDFTLSAFYVRPATKADLTAAIRTRDYAPKGRRAASYLTPEIVGGPRSLKGLEVALQRAGVGIGTLGYTVPGSGATIDAFGNMSPGQIVQILSRLNALAKSQANISDKTTRRLRRKGLTVAASGHRSDIFVARGKDDGKPFGIYQLKGPGHVVPVLIFTRVPPSYRPIFDFERVAQHSLAAHWPLEAEKALNYALATAR